MRIVLQRVTQSSVCVEGREVARIGPGLLLLVGIGREDSEDELRFWSRRIPELRVFRDDAGRMNRSLREVGGEILCISQFTLYGDAAKGRRPGFDQAAPSSVAADLYATFVRLLCEEGVPVQSGLFGARMEVSLVNDGPVTLILERGTAQLGHT